MEPRGVVIKQLLLSNLMRQMNKTSLKAEERAAEGADELQGAVAALAV